MQKSTSFILPMMNFSSNIVYNLSKTYLGNVAYEGTDNWGDYLYIEFSREDLLDSITKELRDHDQYIVEFDEDNSVFFVYKFTDKQKIDIVEPFLDGKYSKISRSYVAKYFPKFTKYGTVSNNWRILIKDEWERPHYIPSLKAMWEEKIGTSLPENAEVWSRPMKRDEIYNYETFKALEDALAENHDSYSY